jgi:hypothetical protein
MWNWTMNWNGHQSIHSLKYWVTIINCYQNVHRSNGFKGLVWQGFQTLQIRMLWYFYSTRQLCHNKSLHYECICLQKFAGFHGGCWWNDCLLFGFCSVVVKCSVSEEHTASIFRVTELVQSGSWVTNRQKCACGSLGNHSYRSGKKRQEFIWANKHW